MTPPMKWIVIDPPREYRAWLGAIPKGVAIATQGGGDELQAVHVFVTKRAAVEKQLADLRRRLKQTGFVWVSWPKKASKLDTDVTEDAIRAVALPLGFVDVKVCAVSEVWSGLKLVIRKEPFRGGASRAVAGRLRKGRARARRLPIVSTTRLPDAASWRYAGLEIVANSPSDQGRRSEA